MPTGLSLHLGLRRVKPSLFASVFTNKLPQENDLFGCDVDAAHMADLAANLGYEVLGTLTNDDALFPVVHAHILDAAGRLGPGDIFLLTFSGHGNQVRDDDADEKDGAQDDTWLFFDEEVRDDAFAALWLHFDPLVRIVVVLDSCHSGTATTMLFKGAEALAEPLVADASPKQAIESANDDPLPTMPFSKQLAERGPVVVLLAACEDGGTTEPAATPDTTSPFTTQLLETYHRTEGQVVNGYEGFHEELQRDYGTAQLFVAGPDTTEFRSYVTSDQPLGI